jgi:hypothetical protein
LCTLRADCRALLEIEWSECGVQVDVAVLEPGGSESDDEDNDEEDNEE